VRVSEEKIERSTRPAFVRSAWLADADEKKYDGPFQAIERARSDTVSPPSKLSSTMTCMLRNYLHLLCVKYVAVPIKMLNLME
jgi:hypothetical protein